MPFDALPQHDLSTRLGRLQRLRWHAEQATDKEQYSFCHCLLHRVALDPELQAAGLEIPVVPEIGTISNEIRMEIIKLALDRARPFFGMSYIFGLDSVKTKIRMIDAAIARERVKEKAAC